MNPGHEKGEGAALGGFGGSKSKPAHVNENESFLPPFFHQQGFKERSNAQVGKAQKLYIIIRLCYSRAFV